jgi:hypothetical protein
MHYSSLPRYPKKPRLLDSTCNWREAAMTKKRLASNVHHDDVQLLLEKTLSQLSRRGNARKQGYEKDTIIPVVQK